MSYTEKQIINECKEKILMEADALRRVAEEVDDGYAKAVETILKCRGRVIVTGLGKTGHIGKKIAASFSSLGTPAYFVHSAESAHGDMGMITKDDVVIMISNSGKSREIVDMLPVLKIINPVLIAITSDKESPLGKAANIVLLVNAGPEIDHMGLAPTSSSTGALAAGDALATVVSAMKGFQKKNFALSHPGGALGQQLIKDYKEQVSK